MKGRNALGVVVLFLVVALLGVGCGSLEITPLATSTPTPVAGIGVPVVTGAWQITLESARQEPEVSRSELTLTAGGGLGFSTTTTQPKPGHTFLVVETTFHNLDPRDQTEVSTSDVYVLDENGSRYAAKDLSEPPEEFVFMVEGDAIEQDFELYCRDASPVPFSIGQSAVHTPTIEIGAGPGTLPHLCATEGLGSPGDAGRLTFSRQEETGLVLGYADPDGSEETSVCSDIAYGNLQFAADGAALLHVAPRQGWPSLYLIEPEGKTYSLVDNGLDIRARFDPTGHWVIFATKKPTEAGEELYAFDRETATITLIQTGEQVSFDFLADGRLITDFLETEDADRQYYLGAADGSTLEPLEIPDCVPDSCTVSTDGQHLIYRDMDSLFNLYLFISDLDGGNAQELVQAPTARLDGVLSPDGQSALVSVVGVGEGNNAVNRAEFHNFASSKSGTVVLGGDHFDLDFSADSQWASVIATVDGHHTLHIVRAADGSVHKVSGVVNAFFSPDSTQLAYTAVQQGGSPEMYVMLLEDQSAQMVGQGVVTGWFPSGTMP
jgi:hypothetical protein